MNGRDRSLQLVFASNVCYILPYRIRRNIHLTIPKLRTLVF
jgi:hypothetical protein